ncbi:MAG: TusE/DsrC/DsvC family sulfur relay protein [Thermodesulfobacteriota bacterium]
MNGPGYGKRKPDVDAEGFLVDQEKWNEDVARMLAAKEGIADLTDEMLDILKFLREYYKKFNAFPILNYVCKNIHQPRECINEEFINPKRHGKLPAFRKCQAFISSAWTGNTTSWRNAARRFGVTLFWLSSQPPKTIATTSQHTPV